MGCYSVDKFSPILLPFTQTKGKEQQEKMAGTSQNEGS